MRATGYDSRFRTWQVVADLAHHIGPLLTLHPGAVALAMGVSRGDCRPFAANRPVHAAQGFGPSSRRCSYACNGV